MKKLICLTVLTLMTTVIAFADIPQPKAPKAKPGRPATLEIKLDHNAKQATLVIPKSQIKQLRAELEAMDTGSDNTAALTSGTTRIQTIVSGIFLSLAFIFGGMWFVRWGRASKPGKALIAIAVAIGLGSAVTLVFANVGPPFEARSITSKLFDRAVFTPYRFASGKIKIETSDSENVVLIVPDVSATPKADE